MTCDTWHMTCDTWHVTHDTYHLTRDKWHVRCDILRGWIFSQNVSSLALTVCDLWYLKIWRKRLTDWLTEWINNEDVCGTATATPGLLNIYQGRSIAVWRRGGCQDSSLVRTGRLDRSYRAVLQGTGLRRETGLLLVLASSLSSLGQNQFLYFSFLMAAFPNLVSSSNLLNFKLLIPANFKTCENDLYCSWYIICNPVFKHLSSILLSTCVIIGPQTGTLPSQIDIICCCNTSRSSGTGHPSDLSLLNIHAFL